MTFDLLSELDPVGVCEGAGLLIDVVDVQNLTHKPDHLLGLVERRGRHYTNAQNTLTHFKSILNTKPIPKIDVFM